MLDLSQEKDPIDRALKQTEICTQYHLRASKVEELVRITERRTNTSTLKRYSLKELFAHETQEISWLIPELLPHGELVILGGPPKSGKTIMAVDAAFAIATGEDDFLGMKCDQGKVLFAVNDCSESSLKRQLSRRGFNGDDERLDVIFDWTIDKLYELEQVIADFRPDLVVIDSLKSISPNGDISENSAEFSNNIYSLRNLLSQYKCSGILIHHTGKSNEAMGVHKLRGSSAIAGAG